MRMNAHTAIALVIQVLCGFPPFLLGFFFLTTEEILV